jgi:hypothetical protein
VAAALPRRTGPDARARAILLALLLGPASGAGSGPIPWFELALLPQGVRSPLLRYRGFACGAVGAADLPLPEDGRLVFISCHGGPYACPGGRADLGRYEHQFTCPPDPHARQIATLHLVSRRSLEGLRAFYREVLGEGFVELRGEAAADERTTFVESAAAGGGLPWSPKRLHVALAATREPFHGAGYPSQVRITLSVNPPSEPRPVVRCRDFDVRTPYDRRYEQRTRSRAERFCWW